MLKKRWLLPVMLLIILLAPVCAEDIEKALLLVSREGGGEDLSEDALAALSYPETAAMGMLSGMGYSVVVNYVKPNEDEDFWISLDTIRNAALETGIPYVMALSSRFKDSTLLWRYDVYNRRTNDIVATDAFFITLIAGVEAMSSIDASIERVKTALAQSVPSQLYDGAPAVTFGQKFTGMQDGVEVRYGGKDGPSAGVVKNGTLDGAPVLFSRGHKVFAEVSKPGYWTKSIVLPKGITGDPVQLPLLQKKTKHSLSFNYAWRMRDSMPSPDEVQDAIKGGKIQLSHAGNFEYRLHLLPDRLFVQAGWGFWGDNTALSGHNDALHHEVRLGPGLYVLPKNDYPLRLLAGTGLALVFSDKGVNFLADPLWLGAEFHFPNWAITSQLRIPDMLGYKRDTFQKTDINCGGAYFSMGVMLKW